MIIGEGLGGLIIIGLWIFCFIDVLLTPETACRNLPKLAWVFIVLLFSLLGSIAWLVAGRPWNRVVTQTRSRFAPQPGRPIARQTGRPMSPDDDDEFLAGLSKRAEEQRRRAQEQNRPEGDPSAN